MEKFDNTNSAVTTEVRKFLKSCLGFLVDGDILLEREVFEPVWSGRNLYNPLPDQRLMIRRNITER